MNINDVQPGDWFVTDPGGRLFSWIELGERIIDAPLLAKRRRGRSVPRWGHAGVASRWEDRTRHTQGCPAKTSSRAPERPWRSCTCGALPDRTLFCVEAEPGGAVEREWRWGARPHLWSTGTGLSSQAMAGYARESIGVPYSFLDYFAIAQHRLHIPAPGLRAYIGMTRHLICSQLADLAADHAGIHLFNDGRWPGYVTPLDLGLLLEEKLAEKFRDILQRESSWRTWH